MGEDYDSPRKRIMGRGGQGWEGRGGWYFSGSADSDETARADPNFKQDSIERWAWAQVAEDADARGDLYQTRPGTLTAGTTRTCRDGSYQDHLLPSLFTGKKDCAGTVLRGEFQRGDARDLKTVKRPVLAHN